MVIFGSSLRLTDCMRQQELKLSLLRLELIQGPCNGTGENEPSFKIVRTVTSGYTPRCYNWGLFREGRFSQPPSCQNFTPVVNTTLLGGGVKASLSTAHGNTAPVCAKPACERLPLDRTDGNRGISCPFPQRGILAFDQTQRRSSNLLPIPSTY